MTDRKSYQQSGQVLQHQQRTAPDAIIKERKSFLDARIPQLTKWIRGGVKPEALVRFALLDMQQNAKLRDADPQSIYLALLACAVTGLEPGALKGEAYLVPFAGKAQFMAGYRGLIKMAKRSREVIGFTSNVVREGDVFDIDLGTANSILHKPSITAERGDVIGSYAIATMISGHREIEFIDRDGLERIRGIADKRGKSPAWLEWPDEMSRKSSVRRLAKRLPLGDDYHISRAIEERIEDTGSATDVLDLETDGAATRALDAAAPPPPAADQELTDEERAAILTQEAHDATHG